MIKLLLALLCAMTLTALTGPRAAEAADSGKTGKLYLDESFLDELSGEFHIVISLAAAAQFMEDLAQGEAKVNYINLPDPRSKTSGSSKGSKSSKASSGSGKRNPAIPDIKEITGYSRDELQGMYEYAGPEVVDDMLKERGFPSFNDVMRAYDILSGEEPAEEGAEESEPADETSSEQIIRSR